MMELKLGDEVRLLIDIELTSDRIKFNKDEILTIISITYCNWYTYTLRNNKGDILKVKSDCFEKVEEMIKLKMVIGENRVVECGEYDVEWRYGTDYKLGGDFSCFEIFDREKNMIHQTIFRCYNYKQQIEITNLILDKLGLNVELVEEDVNKEVLEQIGKLEAELEKLRGMIK